MQLLRASLVIPSDTCPSESKATRTHTGSLLKFVSIFFRKNSRNVVIHFFALHSDRLVPVPSIFFIGELGQPIEIVAGKVESVEALQKRILVAEGIFYQKSQSDQGTPSPGSSNSLPSPKPSSTLTATKDEKKTAVSYKSEQNKVGLYLNKFHSTAIKDGRANVQGGR